MTRPQYRYGYTFNEAVNMHDTMTNRLRRKLKKSNKRIRRLAIRTRKEIEAMGVAIAKGIARGIVNQKWPWNPYEVQ